MLFISKIQKIEVSLFVDYNKKHIFIIRSEHHPLTFIDDSKSIGKKNYEFYLENPELHRELFIYVD